VIRSEGLGRDIDCPDDLVPWTGLKKFSLTAALLPKLKLADRAAVPAIPVLKRHM
jgi:hypothetical protein